MPSLPRGVFTNLCEGSLNFLDRAAMAFREGSLFQALSLREVRPLKGTTSICKCLEFAGCREVGELSFICMYNLLAGRNQILICDRKLGCNAFGEDCEQNFLLCLFTHTVRR